MSRRQPRDVITQPRHGYEKVRDLGPHGWGLPWMLDRWRGALLPYGDEWWQRYDGRWLPVLAGGSWNGRKQMSSLYEIPAASRIANLSQNTVALDSAYTAGSAGDAIGTKAMIPESLTLSTIYFYIVSYTGTAANVSSINWEVRTGNTTPDTSGGGLVASGSMNPASATGWVAISGLSVALTAGTTYWIIIGDANGGGTDFATILRNATYPFTGNRNRFNGVSTTNGWGSTSLVDETMSCVLKFSDGSVWGDAIAVTGTVTASALQKGFHLASGFSAGIRMHGMRSIQDSASYSGIKLYEGTTGPTSGEQAASTHAFRRGTNANPIGFQFAAPETLDAETPYRSVFTVGSSSSIPQKFNIGAGTNADLRATLLGGMVYTVETAAPAWEDDVDGIPDAVLLVADQAEITGGGGGVPMSRVRLGM